MFECNKIFLLSEKGVQRGPNTTALQAVLIDSSEAGTGFTGHQSWSEIL